MSRPRCLLSLFICLLASRALAADSLPPRALARLGDYRFFHGPGHIRAVLSPDAHRVASAPQLGGDGFLEKERAVYLRTIILWDAATGERRHELLVDKAPIECLAFSPDGKRLAAACGRKNDGLCVEVFDSDTGKRLHHLTGFKQDISRVQFSTDGKQLHVSECYGGPVSAWDLASGRQRRQWLSKAEGADEQENNKYAVEGVLSPDGKWLIWRVFTAFSPEIVREGPERLDADDLRVYDAATEKLLYRRTTRHDSLIFSADGKRFVTIAGPQLSIWETAAGNEVSGFTLKGEYAAEIALSPDLRLAVIHQDNHTVRLWDMESGRLLHELCQDSPWKTKLLNVQQVFSADGKTLLTVSYNTLCIWDTSSGRERLVRPGHRSGVQTVAFTADGRTLLSSCAETTCSWNVRSGQEMSRLTARLDPTRFSDALCFSLDRRYCLTQPGYDCVVLRDTATGRKLHELPVKCEDIVQDLFAPANSRVLLFDAESERLHGWLYDVKTGKKLADFVVPGKNILPVFSGDSRFVAFANLEGIVHVHDATNGKVVRTLQSRRPLGDSVKFVRHAFSRDGEYLAIAAKVRVQDEDQPPVVCVFHVRSGKELSRFTLSAAKEEQGDSPLALALSPGGRLLAVAEWGTATIRLIEVASGKERGQLSGHRAEVWSLDFAPDSETLASGGSDKVVVLWDATGARTRKPPAEVSARDLAQWWNALSGDDAARAGEAQTSFQQSSERGVSFLKERLRPVPAVDEKRLAHLLAALDAETFERREAASQELARLGEVAETVLRQALANKPSPEPRRRLEALLEKLDEQMLSTDMLRAVRAIEVLERIGTPAARDLLKELTQGAADARLTRDAQASLKRLEKGKP